MYRKEIKVLDCTIRDGGLINNYNFTDDCGGCDSQRRMSRCALET